MRILNVFKTTFLVVLGLGVLIYVSSTLYMYSQRPKDIEPIPVSSVKWQTFRNDKFEIQYPSTWVVTERFNGSVTFTNTLEVAGINTFTPAYGKAWQRKAVLTVDFLEGTWISSLEQWYDEGQKGDPMPNSRLDSPIAIGGIKTIMEEVSEVDGIQYYYVQNDSTIIKIGHRTHQTNFSALYDHMLASIKFLEEITVGEESRTNAPSDFVLFKSDAGFEFKYPPHWQVQSIDVADESEYYRELAQVLNIQSPSYSGEQFLVFKTNELQCTEPIRTIFATKPANETGWVSGGGKGGELLSRSICTETEDGTIHIQGEISEGTKNLMDFIFASFVFDS